MSGLHSDRYSRRQASLTLGAAALAASWPSRKALANSFPERPVRLLIGQPTGGVQDVRARPLAARLSAIWRQQVLVENRPGGTGALATAALLDAPPDGHQLLLAAVSHTTVPHLQKVNYDIFRDLVPVTRYTASPLLLLANEDVPVRTVNELVELARNPAADKSLLSLGGFGQGGVGHLAVQLLNRQAGTRFQHIPYSGGSQQMVDLISGQIPLLLDFGVVARPHLREGRIKALAVCNDKRLQALPEIPSFAEQGYPGMHVMAWQGFVVRSGTSAEHVRLLHAGLVEAMSDTSIRQSVEADGGELIADSSEVFAAYLRSEYDRWGKLIREAGIRL